MERSTRRVLGLVAAAVVVVAGGLRLSGCSSGKSPLHVEGTLPPPKQELITESYRVSPRLDDGFRQGFENSASSANGLALLVEKQIDGRGVRGGGGGEGLADLSTSGELFSKGPARETSMRSKAAWDVDKSGAQAPAPGSPQPMKPAEAKPEGGADNAPKHDAPKPDARPADRKDIDELKEQEQRLLAEQARKLEEQLKVEEAGRVRLAQAGRYRALSPELARARVAEATRENPAPRFDEELWVISKSPVSAGGKAAAANDDIPGSGGLVCVPGEGQATVPVPLKHTEVNATVTGYVSSVTVTQQFHNPFSGKIEAVYVFPLPENAAVSDFVMKVGERTIRGVIRERGEAERIYYAARAQGYTASLLTQERPNIFTQRVANIEPQKSIDITVTYFNTLSYNDGAFEFVFPMVVGPRFNPPYSPGQDAQPGAGIGAVARGEHGASGEAVEVQYLRPNERSGHDIAVNLSVDLGMPIGEIKSASHAIKVQKNGTKATVSLSSLDRIPNKDLVVKIRPAGEGVRTGVIVQKDERGSFFSMMVVPPSDLSKLSRGPMELVFVVDCSGSMSGYPLDKAKQCIDRALTMMRPGDSFQIIRFAASAAMFADRPQAVTAENVRRGREWLKNLEPGGGTYMIEGVKAALNYPHDAGRDRIVCFMTDGYIGNEAEILGEIRRGLGPTHIFSFGVGSSVNRYLMDSMARVGRGAVAYVGPNDDVADAMDPFVERIGRSAMTELSIDWGGVKAADVFPRRLPDLYVGRPVMITGRLDGFDGFGNLKIRGKIRSETGSNDAAIDVRLPQPSGGISLGQIWARAKIAQLGEEQTAGDSGELREAIRDTALGFNLMSQYTAFVAVDTLTRTAGSVGTTVAVPVPVPEGVKYQTTVSER